MAKKGASNHNANLATMDEANRQATDRRIAALSSPFARFAGGTADAASSTPDAPSDAAPRAVQPVRVSSPAEARALPKGTPILLPDGSVGRVP